MQDTMMSYEDAVVRVTCALLSNPKRYDYIQDSRGKGALTQTGIYDVINEAIGIVDDIQRKCNVGFPTKEIVT